MSESDTLRTERLARLSVHDYALPDDLTRRLSSPSLVIYEEKVARNVQTILGHVNGDASRWRPHLKTTKTGVVYSMLVAAGIRHFKCATVREASLLLGVIDAAGVTDADLLIAYPLQGPSLLAAGRLVDAHPATRISILSEDPAHVSNVSAALGIFVDVNAGMHRTGIPVDQHARIVSVARAAGERFRGVHAYDGHIHDATADERRRHAHAGYQPVVALLDALAAEGLPAGELITSGTPAFRYALDFPGFANGRVGNSQCVHRVSPGTVVFHDLEYDSLLEDTDLVPAAVVFSRVVSHPNEGLITCDAGSKSIAAERGDPVGFPIGHPELEARSPSEEHLPMAVTGNGAPPALGEMLYLVPRHVCPTVNLAEEALFVRRDGTAEAVPVAARGHDLLID